ncbi:UNVERIFIED_CONTAM: hypothetical protein FKN15_033218 [Acipenser sinensis]
MVTCDKKPAALGTRAPCHGLDKQEAIHFSMKQYTEFGAVKSIGVEEVPAGTINIGIQKGNTLKMEGINPNVDNIMMPCILKECIRDEDD